MLTDTLEATKAGLESEIAVVNRQKEFALQEFNIKYAAELEKKVQSYIKSEYERIDSLNKLIGELLAVEERVTKGELIV
jgi:chemotaxis protein histidine kinase CheA